MNKLILMINKLQHLNSKYDVPDILLPQIIVVGSQSSGKSSVLERIIGHDILPKAAAVCTRCPIILQLIYSVDMGSDVKAIFMDNAVPVYGIENIAEALELQHKRVGQSRESVSSEPIMVQLYGSSHPTLTLIDLPGIIKNDGELPAGSTEKILSLTEEYAAAKKSIILAISAANVDMANSDAIHVSRKFDPEGRRTINVITKIDLMDRGTTISDVLKNRLLENGLPPICVVNRSQESVTNRLTIEEANEYEKQFIRSKSMDITGDHGVAFLNTVLVNKLESEIFKHLPEIHDAVNQRIDLIRSQIESDLDVINNKDIIINKTITLFIAEYKKLLLGTREGYPGQIVGGAKISHILYDEYEKDILNFKVTKRSNESILILLRNVAGVKKMSYSIENAFACIVREEVDKFKGCSLKSNDAVKILLIEFIQDIIKEFHLDKYINLASKIEREMNTFINYKHSICTKIIENAIRGEKDDIYCLRPNTIMFQSLDSKYQQKVLEAKEKAFKDIVESVAKNYGILLSPQMKRLIINAYNSKTLNVLKDAVSQFLDDQITTPTSKTTSGRFNQTIPQALSDMVNNVTENGLESKAVFDSISKEKQFPAMIKDISERSVKCQAITDDGNNPNIAVLEDMVYEYFKLIQENMIRNIPKWIQTVFVKDILGEIDDALHCIRREDDLDNLLDISFEEAHRIQMKKAEMEELICIAEELRSLRRQR